MVRVKPNRCGWRGNVCKGIPKLDPAIVGTGLVCDPSYSPSITNLSLIDNYLNLPAQARGFVMKEHILDMANSNLPVAERECYDFRDSSGGLFLNLYASYAGYPLDHASVEQSQTPSYIQLSVGYACFPNGTTLEPGWLEPMINAELPNVDIEGPASWEFGIDGLIISLIGFIRWRKYIDELIGSLYPVNFSPIINALLDSPPCGGLKIRSSGSLLRWAGTTGEPTFSVDSGSITLNGVGVAVSGLGSFTVGSATSTLVYVELTLQDDDEDKGSYKVSSAMVKRTSSKPSRSSSKACIEIGTIQQLSLPRKGHTPSCRVWRINQANCDIDTDRVRLSKAGVLFTRGPGSSMPYGVHDTGNCDGDEQGNSGGQSSQS